MTEPKRIVVIGAGVIGLCVAYSLQRRGHDVVIVERGRDGGDSCSLGNAGLVSPSHFIPLAEPSNTESPRSPMDPRGPTVAMCWSQNSVMPLELLRQPAGAASAVCAGIVVVATRASSETVVSTAQLRILAFSHADDG